MGLSLFGLLKCHPSRSCPLSSKWSLFNFSFIINANVLSQNMPEMFVLLFQSLFVVDYYISGQLRRESLNSGVLR